MDNDNRIARLEQQIDELSSKHDVLHHQLAQAQRDQWQSRIEDLEVQFHLGAMEANDRANSLLEDLRRKWAEVRGAGGRSVVHGERGGGDDAQRPREGSTGPPPGPARQQGADIVLIADARLADGTPAQIRQLVPEDREDLREAYEHLPESRRRRFLGAVPHLTDAMLDHLVDEVDGVDHVALVLTTDGEDDVPLPVGVARMIRYEHEPSAADVGVTVRDEWQGRGVATALLSELVRNDRRASPGSSRPWRRTTRRCWPCWPGSARWT